MLSILNYGMANLRSVQRAFERIDVAAQIIATEEEIRAADRLVLPGVGAVGDALAHLRSARLDQAIVEHIRRGKPFLGICLGLQMLMTECHEGGTHAGLNVVPGDCLKLQVPVGMKVPHMGWHALDVGGESAMSPFAGRHFYFVHSYHVRPLDPAWIAATVDYPNPIVAAIARDNVLATQFHPEKSQQVGRDLLKQFMAI
jgi:imidazole glycerol-phosphate synthase subunit HisH